MRFLILLVSAIAASSLCACGARRLYNDVMPEDRWESGWERNPASVPGPQGGSTTAPAEGLPEALALHATDLRMIIAERNPEFRAYRERVAAARHAQEQASSYKNPKVGLRAEMMNIEEPDFEESNRSIGLSQPIELGGKREARVRRAGAEIEFARAVRETKFESLVLESERAYYSVVVERARIRLLKQKLSNAEARLTILTQAHSAGGVSDLQLAREQTEPPKMSVEVLEQEKELAAAENLLRRLLALPPDTELQYADEPGQAADELLSAASAPEFVSVPPAGPELEPQSPSKPETGPIAPNREPAASDTGREPTAPRPTTSLEDHPEMLIARARWAVATERIREAQVEPIPDLDLELGYMRSGDKDAEFGGVGIGLVLPLFNANTGRIAEAQREASALGAEMEDVRNSLTARHSSASAGYETTSRAAAKFRNEILPRSRAALEATREQHRLGGISRLALLEEENRIIDIELAELRTLAAFLDAAAELRYFRHSQ
ncbi:MAG: TolC family protein [Planctomycetota bacterium]|nr:TolC family protein [Planctomycetota bacterium]